MDATHFLGFHLARHATMPPWLPKTVVCGNVPSSLDEGVCSSSGDRTTVMSFLLANGLSLAIPDDATLQQLCRNATVLPQDWSCHHHRSQQQHWRSNCADCWGAFFAHNLLVPDARRHGAYRSWLQQSENLQGKEDNCAAFVYAPSTSPQHPSPSADTSSAPTMGTMSCCDPTAGDPNALSSAVDVVLFQSFSNTFRMKPSITGGGVAAQEASLGLLRKKRRQFGEVFVVRGVLASHLLPHLSAPRREDAVPPKPTFRCPVRSQNVAQHRDLLCRLVGQEWLRVLKEAHTSVNHLLPMPLRFDGATSSASPSRCLQVLTAAGAAWLPCLRDGLFAVHCLRRNRRATSSTALLSRTAVDDAAGPVSLEPWCSESAFSNQRGSAAEGAMVPLIRLACALSASSGASCATDTTLSLLMALWKSVVVRGDARATADGVAANRYASTPTSAEPRPLFVPSVSYQAFVAAAIYATRDKDAAIDRLRWAVTTRGISKAALGLDPALAFIDVSPCVSIINTMDCDVPQLDPLELVDAWKRVLQVGSTILEASRSRTTLQTIEARSSGGRRRGADSSDGCVVNADNMIPLLVFCLLSSSAKRLYALLLMMQAAHRFAVQLQLAIRMEPARAASRISRRPEDMTSDTDEGFTSAHEDACSASGLGAEEEDYALVTYEVCVAYLASGTLSVV